MESSPALARGDGPQRTLRGGAALRGGHDGPVRRGRVGLDPQEVVHLTPQLGGLAHARLLERIRRPIVGGLRLTLTERREAQRPALLYHRSAEHAQVECRFRRAVHSDLSRGDVQRAARGAIDKAWPSNRRGEDLAILQLEEAQRRARAAHHNPTALELRKGVVAAIRVDDDVAPRLATTLASAHSHLEISGRLVLSLLMLLLLLKKEDQLLMQ